ncbi:hypothetical protein ACFY8W_26515 [Streptomyces sp. NPDC012637]|uniref:hypothetical protein n=1 Tax=Streptomyces sp. NPDC012637 TaxID=3364842 RepID=UPI0036E637BA
MRDNDTSGRAGSGLSTEDIARGPGASERARGSEPVTGPESGTGREAGGEGDTGSGAPPTYPGESVPTSGEDAGTGAGTATGTRRDREGDDRADTATVAGAETGAETRADTGAETRAETGGDTGGVRADRPADESPRLMEPTDEEGFRTRWHDIQSMFVDDPREAVHAADTLVADVMQKLAATFADHRRTLEGQWKQGEGVDTEDLRTALRQYRSFFRRLLSHGADDASEGSA